MRILVCLMMLVVLAVAAPAADITGKWSGSFVPAGGESQSAFLMLKQSGTTVTGSGGPNESEQWPMTKGKLEGAKLTGEVQNPDGIIYKLNLVVTADSIKGEIEAVPANGPPMKGTLDLTRVK